MRLSNAAYTAILWLLLCLAMLRNLICNSHLNHYLCSQRPPLLAKHLANP